MSTIAIGTWAPVKQQYFNPGASKKKMRPGARMRPGRILCFPACTVLYMSAIAIGTWAPAKQQYFNPGASRKKMRPGASGRILYFRVINYVRSEQ